MTAAGKVIDQQSGRPGLNLQKTLQKWNSLPQKERVPGAVKILTGSPVDPQFVDITPPVGCLVLKVYTRALMTDDTGKLRNVIGKDLWFDEHGKHTLEAEFQDGRTAAHEAQPHHMWLAETEWKALIPANPKKDDAVSIPSGVKERFIRWHLNPLRFYGRYGPDALERKEIRANQLTLKVDSVTPAKVRLRLEGYAKLGQKPPAAVVDGKIASLALWGYEPKVLGYLEYDPKKRNFTRIDIVALGNHFGRLGLGKRAPSRVGLQPLGIAFQLIEGDRPADRVPPGRPANSRTYFAVSK